MKRAAVRVARMSLALKVHLEIDQRSDALVETLVYEVLSVYAADNGECHMLRTTGCRRCRVHGLGLAAYYVQSGHPWYSIRVSSMGLAFVAKTRADTTRESMSTLAGLGSMGSGLGPRPVAQLPAGAAPDDVERSSAVRYA